MHYWRDERGNKPQAGDGGLMRLLLNIHVRTYSAGTVKSAHAWHKTASRCRRIRNPFFMFASAPITSLSIVFCLQLPTVLPSVYSPKKLRFSKDDKHDEQLLLYIVVHFFLGMRTPTGRLYGSHCCADREIALTDGSTTSLYAYGGNTFRSKGQ